MRILLAALALVSLTGLAVSWARSDGRAAFATPAACVEAYYQALKDADVDAYRACLCEALRGTSPGAADLRARGRDLRGWILRGEEAGVVLVDEQYSTRKRRQKLYVEREGSSWRLARTEIVEELAGDIPYGTHVSEVAGNQFD